MLELYQFPVSHYCEKVRWALDYKGIPFRVHNLVPLLHIPVMVGISRQTQVPVIRLGRRVVHDSRRIIDFVERHYPGKESLYPEDAAARKDALEWQAFCDRELGPHVRRAAYFHILEDRLYTRALLTEGQGFAGQSLYTLAQRGIILGMRYGLKINRNGYDRSMAKLGNALDRIEARLKGRRYLVGERFSVADLTAAALLAPLVQPPRMPYPAPDGEPEAFAALRLQLAPRASLQWVSQMYESHRGSSNNPVMATPIPP